MQVTVLGKSPSWQDAGGACSGYLVQQEDFTLLLDCGSGVFSKLRALRDYGGVDAALITHMHADHFLDLVPFSYALTYGARRLTGGAGDRGAASRQPRLYLPLGGRALLRRLVGCWGSEDLVDEAFHVREYTHSDEVAVGPLRLRFCPVPHYVTAHAVELVGDHGRFVFGADCGPNEQLTEFARDADLLMLEATLVSPEGGGERGHLTAREAGEHARAARARRLVLTHFSDELDPARMQADAAAGFGAPVELAREGAAYRV